MQDTPGLIIIIIRTSGRILREIPVSIVGARNNGIGTRNGVEKSATVGAIAVDICAGDLWGGGLNAFYILVDGADGTFFGGGLEPGGEVVSGSCGGGVGDCGEGDGVGDTGFEGAGLGAGAGTVGYCTLLDARVKCTLLSKRNMIPKMYQYC
jgi:hypothetical protein